MMQLVCCRAARGVARAQQLFKSTAAAAAVVPEEDVLPFDAIPGPSGVPFLGNVPLAMKYQDKGGTNQLGLHVKLYEEHGDFYRLNLGGMDMLYTGSVADWDKVIRSEGKYPSGTAQLLWQMEAVKRRFPERVPDTIDGFMTKGEQWRKTRHSLQPFVFSLDGTRAMQPQMNEAARRASERLPEYIERDDLEKFCQHAAFDVFCAVALDKEMGTIDGTEDEATKQFVFDVSDHFLAMVETFPLRFMKEYDFFLDRWGNFQRYEKGFLRALEWSQQYALKALKDNPEGNGILHNMVRGGFTQEEAANQFYSLLIASVDTTGDNLLKTLHLLAEHPDKQQKLRDELTEVLGGGDYDVKAKLPYLTAVQREAQRFRPFGVCGLARQLEDDIVLRGHNVPAGTFIHFCEIPSVLDEKIAGPNPDEYHPERYLPDAVKARKEAGNSHIDNPIVRAPFSRGARSCLGMRIAQLELDTVLARVVQDHTFGLPESESQVAANKREYRQALGNRPFPRPKWELESA